MELDRAHDSRYKEGFLRNEACRDVLDRVRTEAFINGDFHGAASGERLATENPATGEVIAEIASCGAPDVDRAVVAARRAFEDGRWASLAPAARKECLLRLAGLVESHTNELAILEALEVGKPISDCQQIDLPETVRTFRWFAEAIDKMYGEIAPTESHALGLVIREPVGVVGAVLPWNFPIMLAAWKVAPALAAGNSVVIKPAELSSLSTLRLAELATQAGIPDGVLNVVPGLGETAGEALGRHRGVDAIVFTGSTEVGRQFLRYSAESNLKRISLECGGKSPQIVLADAPELDGVAQGIVTAGFANMGENCTCGSRLLVHESLEAELLDRVISTASDWTVGDPMDPRTKVGPMVEAKHLAKVLRYIDSGLSSGARAVYGGHQTLRASGGHFIEPTILTNVTNDMPVAREEIFGPVISVIPFATESEAVRLANDTNYGLAASVWSSSFDTAMRVARSIRAGTVAVNCYSEGDISTPFGGYKESGFGGRDKSLDAFSQYTESKTIWIRLE